jgi:hypothetical protein
MLGPSPVVVGRPMRLERVMEVIEVMAIGSRLAATLRVTRLTHITAVLDHMARIFDKRILRSSQVSVTRGQSLVLASSCSCSVH